MIFHNPSADLAKSERMWTKSEILTLQLTAMHLLIIINLDLWAILPECSVWFASLLMFSMLSQGHIMMVLSQLYEKGVLLHN